MIDSDSLKASILTATTAYWNASNINVKFQLMDVVLGMNNALTILNRAELSNNDANYIPFINEMNANVMPAINQLNLFISNLVNIESTVKEAVISLSSITLT